MAAALDRLACLLLTAWVGSLWTVGYLVAPTLFAVLDRPEAGRVAGQLFAIEAWTGLAAGGLLAILGATRRATVGRRAGWAIALMLVSVAAGHFLVQPEMAQARGTPRFGMLHGLASGLYLATSLLGGYLVWIWPGFSRRAS
jgi:hypothetical protein